MGYGTLFISHHDDDTYFIMLMLVYVHVKKVNSFRIPQSLILLRKIIVSNLIMACRDAGLTTVITNHVMVNCVDARTTLSWRVIHWLFFNNVIWLSYFLFHRVQYNNNHIGCSIKVYFVYKKCLCTRKKYYHPQ